MSTKLIGKDVWQELSAAARDLKRPAYVAVAYFGQDGSKLLKLKKGSRLVVDASLRAVKSGQTCPAELLSLVNKGVRVYSTENLHAKVYVLGNKAFIGSANASHHSKSWLVEAMLRTSDAATVTEAREFVKSLCDHPLGPAELEVLVKAYRPPNIDGVRGEARTKRSPKTGALQKRVHVAQVHSIYFSDEAEAICDAGRAVARKKLTHPRSWVMDEFKWNWPANFRRGERVIQVLNDSTRSRTVLVPGNVVHVERRRKAGRSYAFAYLEHPPGKKAKSLKAVAEKLGGKAKKRLTRGGPLNPELASRLLALWKM